MLRQLSIILILCLQGMAAFKFPFSRSNWLSAPRAIVHLKIAKPIVQQRSQPLIITNPAERYEALLDDIIYPGDVPGCLRSVQQPFVLQVFAAFLQEKHRQLSEHEEKQVIQGILDSLPSSCQSSYVCPSEVHSDRWVHMTH